MSLTQREILRLKTLIEIYDRELTKQGRFHVLYTGCKKCRSLIEQKIKMVLQLKNDALEVVGE